MPHAKVDTKATLIITEGLDLALDLKERGRLVELFFLQAEDGKGITTSTIDIAIKKYRNAKQAQLETSQSAGKGEIVVSEIDDFALSLLEEAKWFLEKGGRNAGNSLESPFLHAALLVAFCSLEAHVNSVADDFALRPGVLPHEISADAGEGSSIGERRV